MKVVKEEKVGNEVKINAVRLMANLAMDATIKPKMFSESLLKVS